MDPHNHISIGFIKRERDYTSDDKKYRSGVFFTEAKPSGPDIVFFNRIKGNVIPVFLELKPLPGDDEPRFRP